MREMKDSGIEWIGEIPKDWSLKKGRYLFVQRNDRGNDENLQLLSPSQKFGVIPQSLLEDLTTQTTVKLKENTDLSTLKTVHKGDFCISLRSFQGGFEYSEYEGVVSPAYQIFYKKEDLVNTYYKYIFKDSSFISKMNSYTMSLRDGKNISYFDFGNTYLPLPTVCEQQQIADYLDTQCSEIDATAEDIQKEISLLEDYKKSVITEAVTKGLNPDAEMKDSGIAWIGDIPKDWDLLKIGYVTKEISDIDHYMPSDSDDIDKVPYVMIGDLKENISQIDFESCKYISKKVYRALSIKSKPEKENVIFARYATIGTVCFVDSEKQLLVSYACLTVKANELIKGRFLFYYFKSNAFLEEVSQYVKSNTQGNIGKESLVRAKIVVPKLKEQTQIISYLDSKCSEIDAIIADKKRQRGILAEYKKSLIYEYVTGKKEVPVHE